MSRLVILIILELVLFAFFVVFMKSDSMYVLAGLIILAAIGLYGYRKLPRLRQTLSEAFSTYRWLSYLIFLVCVFFIPFIFKDSAYLVIYSICGSHFHIFSFMTFSTSSVMVRVSSRSSSVWATEIEYSSNHPLPMGMTPLLSIPYQYCRHIPLSHWFA